MSLVKGRTGEKMSKPSITRLEKREDNSLFIRVDDPNNLEFWLEITVPFEEMLKLSKGK